MQRLSSLIASGLLLGIILISVTIVATTATPNRTHLHTSTSLVVSTVATKTNMTKLVVRIAFPNGTTPDVGELKIGSISGERVGSQFVFDNVTPGTYQLNFSKALGIYFPAANVKILPGLNSLNVTVYQLEVFQIVVTQGPSLNGSTPAPIIRVPNDTVVQFEILNNTTLIQNLAVVDTLNNTEYSNVLFNSLSETISAGGSANDTFVVSQSGTFYYACLIGNDAKAGEYGFFLVQ